LRRLVALDLDGTLVDSAPDLAHCLGRALEPIGLEAPGESLTREWIGDGVEMLVRRGLEHGLGPDLDENVPATLDRVRDRGIVVGCITNKRAEFADRLLELAGIRGRLDFLYGGDSCADKKPSPAQLLAACHSTGIGPGESVLVGDSANDLKSAEAAGFRFVFAAYGYTAGVSPDAVRTQLRIDRFEDLADLPLLA
jgi:phosphoglycolate phosphatase